MTETTPTNPIPTAVPWTPDLMNQGPAAPIQSPAPMAQPMPTTQRPAPIAAPAHFAAPAQPAPQTMPLQPYMNPQHLPPHTAPQHAQATTQAPREHHNQYAQPQHAHQQSQHMPGQQPMQQGHHGQMMAHTPAAQHGHYPNGPIPAPAAYSPQHMEIPAENLKPKSLIGRLLKPSPKSAQTEPTMVPNLPLPTAAPVKSGGLFNKNFALGAVTGLIVGAFVLPLMLGMLGGSEQPIQAQAGSSAQFDPSFTQSGLDPNAAPADTGSTFLDTALETTKP